MGRSDKGLSLSASLGYNASKWLAHVLDRGEVRAYHERLYAMLGIGRWQATFAYFLENPVSSPKVKPYWDEVKKDIKNGYDVFDANIWPSYIIPEIHNYFPLKQVLYVTRNGITWMDSVMASSSLRKPHKFATNTYLKRYWIVLGKPRKPWKQWTHWERICLYWSTSYSMANWLEKQGIPVYRYRMEDLTGGVAIYDLFDLFNIEIDEDNVQRLQQTVINKHTRKKSSVKDIWETWTTEQKDHFTEICEKGMDFYDYQIF